MGSGSEQPRNGHASSRPPFHETRQSSIALAGHLGEDKTLSGVLQWLFSPGVQGQGQRYGQDCPEHQLTHLKGPGGVLQWDLEVDAVKIC